MRKKSVNLDISQDSHKNQYPSPICNFGSFEPQYSDKCWSNLLLKCHNFSLVTHTVVAVLPAWSSDSSVWLVCVEPVTMCWCDSIIKWHHHFTSECCYYGQGSALVVQKWSKTVSINLFHKSSKGESVKCGRSETSELLSNERMQCSLQCDMPTVGRWCDSNSFNAWIHLCVSQGI